LVTWLVYFELINRELILSNVVEPILFLAMFSILALWSKHLQGEGLKVKWFPNKKIAYIAFTIGFCLGLFGDEIGVYIYEELSPLVSYIAPLTTTMLLVYFGHRFPLSEAVLNEKR